MVKNSLTILLFLLLVSCTINGSGPSPVETANGVTPQPVVITITESPEINLPTPTIHPPTYYFFEPGVNPLTGLPVSNPILLERRPVMVKISNWPREGRPHAGLSQADIVFEHFIGFQMNRFTAIYYGENAEQIGPVRSGRLVDGQLATLYQGLLAYGNADPQVDLVLREALGDRALAFNYLHCPAMCGTSTYAATGVYANSTALTDHALAIGIDNVIPDLRGMLFQAEPPTGDAPGRTLRVEYANFSIMQWYFDHQLGKYELWMEAQEGDILVLAPVTDRNNGSSITVENLIVMFAEYVEFAPTLHNIRIEDMHTPHKALLFRDGRVTYGTWRTPDPGRPIIFERLAGDSMPLKPGRTWVVIVGLNSIVTTPEEDFWRIDFFIP